MLKGHTAIVTGGSRGIGAAVAKKLGSLGADIAVIYAGSEQRAKDVCTECEDLYKVRAMSYRCDVADYEQVKETVGQIRSDLDHVGILINNAGITRDGLIATMKESDFDQVLDTNLKGVFHMIRHTCGLLIRGRYGRIVNISSVSGLMGNAGQSNYAASKAGIVGLTKSVARELAPRGITCNAVAPGFITTDMTKDLLAAEQKVLDQIPLKKAGTAQDVADAVAFLVQAGYITGEVLRVDGGMAM